MFNRDYLVDLIESKINTIDRVKGIVKGQLKDPGLAAIEFGQLMANIDQIPDEPLFSFALYINQAALVFVQNLPLANQVESKAKIRQVQDYYRDQGKISFCGVTLGIITKEKHVQFEGVIKRCINDSHGLSADQCLKLHESTINDAKMRMMKYLREQLGHEQSASNPDSKGDTTEV